MEPTTLALVTAAAAGAASAVAWLGILLHPARPADCRPVADDEPPPPEPGTWPAVVALVPARNEADVLPRTLPALLAQDYPGRFRVILVDDRSDDGTGAVARDLGAAGGRLDVLDGAPLPEGWTGKLWALEQARRRAGGDVAWLWLTDADVSHSADSLRRLVAESIAHDLAGNSRMARLHCDSAWEKLLIPAFVWFFNLLYPMRWIRDPARTTAAAAGGCILLRRQALEAAGGFAAIRDCIIDDVSLARSLKRHGGRLALAWSRARVRSLRAATGLGGPWRMVRRTAFTELRHSPVRLLGCLAGLLLLFAAPPVALATGLALGRAGLVAVGAGASALQAIAYRPAPRFFGLGWGFTLAFPLAGLLYGAMTCDSARLHWRGRRDAWRGSVPERTESIADA